MNDNIQTPPPESLHALKSAASNLPTSHVQLADRLRHMYEQPHQHKPHAVYVVTLKNMASAGGLSNATLVGWRYVSISDHTKALAVDIHHDADGSNHRFAGLSRGAAIDALSKVLHDERIGAHIESGAFNLSTVSIPALDVVAVWLRHASGGIDVVAVVPPAPRFLEPWPHTYAVQQFENAVREAAADKVKLHRTVYA